MPASVLVVDDDEQIRKFLAHFLELEGYTPYLAGDGREALEFVARSRPDLILLDVEMRDVGGFAVCRQLKQDPLTALIPITMLTGQDDREARRTAIEAGADDFLSKPIDPSMLRARLRTHLRIKRLIDQLENTERVIFSMARWVEIKDPYTNGHLQRIAGYSERIAQAFALAPDEVQTIRYAGILHDIGKIGVADGILDKAGTLTDEEREEVQRHSEHGASIIAPLRFAAQVAPIVRAHHEHWDGSGYPLKLRGDAIPLGARIIAVVDAFDAMTTDRPYRRSLGVEEAVRRLKAGSGTQWDPRVVDAFLELLMGGELPLGDAGADEPAAPTVRQGECRNA